MMQKPALEYKNLLLAVALSAILIVGWQVFIEAPKRAELARWNQAQQQQKAAAIQAEQTRAHLPAEAAAANLTREERLAQSPRVAIASPALDGSISLKGLRFDDLQLVKYRTTLDPQSPEVVLLSPHGGQDAYFMQLGWIAAPGTTARLPDENTLWKADHTRLTPEQPVTFTHENGAGLRFEVRVSLDARYMFDIKTRVTNAGGAPVSLSPYAFVNRTHSEGNLHNVIMHDGPLGVMDGALNEVGYETLREKGPQKAEGTTAWLGFTDKYWLAALVPDAATPYAARFDHYKRGEQDRYQAEMTAPPTSLAPGGSSEAAFRFFAGAKEIEALDAYTHGEAKGGTAAGAPVALFDRAVDFGMLYFLTKPMFLLLNYFYKLVGNFGIAILLLTLAVKLAMFPIAHKGYGAAAKMRKLQPEMLRLRELHGEDRLKMQQEMMALYKREKVNPAAGCLPILIQIPVFFALYKVLFVTIEMRHAPFFGWLRDLSAPDPSNIFTLFGLIPWTPPSFLHLGILPILMGITMIIQMKQQPKPTDPVQAKMMTYMPYFFTVLLATMPAGLVLYWTFSNLFSIAQQGFIELTHVESDKAQAKKSRKRARSGHAEP